MHRSRWQRRNVAGLVCVPLRTAQAFGVNLFMPSEQSVRQNLACVGPIIRMCECLVVVLDEGMNRILKGKRKDNDLAALCERYAYRSRLRE